MGQGVIWVVDGSLLIAFDDVPAKKSKLNTQIKDFSTGKLITKNNSKFSHSPNLKPLQKAKKGLIKSLTYPALMSS